MIGIMKIIREYEAKQDVFKENKIISLELVIFNDFYSVCHVETMKIKK